MRKQINEIKKEVKTKVVGYLVAAFGLVAGLAWNDAVKSLIEFLFPPAEGNTIIVKFIYAFIVTIIVVAITLVLTRAIMKENKDKS